MRVIVAEGLGYPEGPVFLPDARVLVTDIRGGVVLAVGADGRVARHADTGGGPNGLARGPGGVVYCANNGGLNWVEGRATGPSPDYASGSVQSISPSGEVTVLHVESEAGQLVAPNDIACDSAGGVWFTDSGRGLDGATDAFVLYIDPDLQRVTVAADGYRFSNGLAFFEGESELIVAESGTGELWVHPVLGPGKLGERRLFATMPRPHRPDGICIDVEGNVVVAGALGRGVIVYDDAGNQLERFEFEHRLVTNVAFGGLDQSTLYVTESGLGRLWAIPWPRAGLTLPFLESGEVRE
ncbi:MAG: gluconolactonase [Acidimicrobiaceae bacterium]